MAGGGDISDSSSSAFPPLPGRGAVVLLTGSRADPSLWTPSGSALLHLGRLFSGGPVLTPGQGHQAGGHVSLSL